MSIYVNSKFEIRYQWESIIKDKIFDRRLLKIGDNIGKGHFGIVKKATLMYNGKLRDVAVKSLIDYDGETEYHLKEEAKNMISMNHINVLKLIGVCFVNKKSKYPSLIMPFMSRKDLLTYVKDPNNENITVRQLVDFSLQIATGMHYISTNKFVHRDLAARNCMLSWGFVVKIADFGLSRQLNVNSDYYKSKRGVPLTFPIRWTAPEILISTQAGYTIKADVWSYGVTCWELFTR